MTYSFAVMFLWTYLSSCFVFLYYNGFFFKIMKLEWHEKIIDTVFAFQARPLFVQALEKGNSDGLVDVRLQNEYNSSEMACMVACAAACVRHSARRRPRMSQVSLQSSEVTLSSHNRSIILVYILQFLFLFYNFFYIIFTINSLVSMESCRIPPNFFVYFYFFWQKLFCLSRFQLCLSVLQTVPGYYFVRVFMGGVRSALEFFSSNIT